MSTKNIILYVSVLIVIGAAGFAVYLLTQDEQQQFSVNDVNKIVVPTGGEGQEEQNEIEDTTVTSSGSLYALDDGFRAEDASNPFIISVDDDKIVFAYQNQDPELRAQPSGKSAQFVETTDGLTFMNLSSSGREVRERAVQVADGTWRRYIYLPTKGGLMSESSTDGVTFSEDEGVRYAIGTDSLVKGIENIFGVYTYFTDDKGGVVILHNETTDDGIVVSRLYAAPETNGMSFKKMEENILGGTLEIDNYADPYAIKTSEGNIKLVVMHQGEGAKPPAGRTGEIYTYTSTDNGQTFTLDGLAFSWKDFTDVEVRSLNDPKIVELSDGQFRIYAAAMIEDDSGEGDDKEFRWMLVSAVGP